MTIERLDKYTISIDGHRVRATSSQESVIAAMPAEQRIRFLTVMGHLPALGGADHGE